jgi:hypothetical protein
MRSQRHGKRDGNHKEICDIFPPMGWQIAETTAQGGFVDAVAVRKYDLLTVVIEIKVLDKDSHISLKQLEFLSNWAGHSAILATKEDAESLCAKPNSKCLTIAQKDRLAFFCQKERDSGATDKKSYAITRILKMF